MKAAKEYNGFWQEHFTSRVFLSRDNNNELALFITGHKLSTVHFALMLSLHGLDWVAYFDLNGRCNNEITYFIPRFHTSVTLLYSGFQGYEDN